MDGNGRWAQERGLPRTAGHREGIKKMEEIIYASKELGIKFLTLYVFSTENWKRPKNEIENIFKIAKNYFHKKIDELKKKDIRLRFIGRRDRLPKSILNLMKNANERTKNCKSLTVILAIDYGGKDEIIRAVNKILQSNTKSVTEKSFSQFLDLSDVPEPDLLIRTAGEKRISNFLLWYIAYTEFYFSPLYWPDFNKKELLKALEDFNNRKRKYGALK